MFGKVVNVQRYTEIIRLLGYLYCKSDTGFTQWERMTCFWPISLSKYVTPDKNLIGKRLVEMQGFSLHVFNLLIFVFGDYQVCVLLVWTPRKSCSLTIWGLD